jgi:molecular chaperone HtpG
LCITKENCELGEKEDETKAFEDLKTEIEPAIKKIKDIIGKDCDKSVVSKRVVVAPCVIVTGEYGWTANFQRLI